MATDRNTQQPPIADSSTRMILAERVYLAPSETSFSDPAAKYAGVAPGSPWVDLGIVQGSKVDLAYTKTIKKIETGIDRILRGSYVETKGCIATFTLEQTDIAVLEAVTGLTSDVVGSPSIGSKIHIGQEDVVEKALLFTGTNKLDGKETICYCKKASLAFNLEQADDARVIKVTAELYAFVPTGETIEALFSLYVLD